MPENRLEEEIPFNQMLNGYQHQYVKNLLPEIRNWNQQFNTCKVQSGR